MTTTTPIPLYTIAELREANQDAYESLWDAWPVEDDNSIGNYVFDEWCSTKSALFELCAIKVEGGRFQNYYTLTYHSKLQLTEMTGKRGWKYLYNNTRKAEYIPNIPYTHQRHVDSLNKYTLFNDSELTGTYMDGVAGDYLQKSLLVDGNDLNAALDGLIDYMGDYCEEHSGAYYKDAGHFEEAYSHLRFTIDGTVIDIEPSTTEKV